MEEAPIKGLERFVGQEVEVIVKDGRKFRGKMIQVDEHTNIILEEAEELDTHRKHKLIFLKGGNVLEILL
ncbi:MAG: LSM domain-containing protein [Candidatus Hadarchaeales archaeon]